MGIHEVAARFFQSLMAGSWVPEYLARRGFDDAVQQDWRAGYAPAGRDALTRHLRAAGYPDPLIVASGLARRSRRGFLTDTFRDRAVLPIRSARGGIVAFIGRAGEHAGPDSPRYLNSPATILFEKSLLLFGLWEARPALAAGAVPVIAEGPFDVLAIAVAGRGRFAPVAPCGTALTWAQAGALGQAAGGGAGGVLTAFDADEAGRRAAVRAYRLLSQFPWQARAVRLPPGNDPAQLLAEHGAAALAAALAQATVPLADLVIDAELGRWGRWLRSGEGRVAALRAIAPVIAAMPPPDVARQVARLADGLELDHGTVTEAVTGALSCPGCPAGSRAGR